MTSDDALDALALALAAQGLTPATVDALLTLAEQYGDTRADDALTHAGHSVTDV